MMLQSLIDSLKACNDYINGGRYGHLDLWFARYNTRLDDLRTEFMLTGINNLELAASLRTILTSLDIPEEQICEYLQSELSVYEFFMDLSRKGHLQSTSIVELIDSKTAFSTLTLFLAALVSTAVAAGAGASLLFIDAFSEVLALLKHFLASNAGLPILGLLKAVTTLAFFSWLYLSDDKQPWFNRIRDTSFQIVNALILIIGNIIWIAYASPITPLVAALFIVSPVLDVIKELFCLIQEIYQYNNKTIARNENSLSDMRGYTRHESGFNKHLYAAIINLAVAVAIMGIMIAWCFMPGGLLVSIVAIVSLGLVYGVKLLALSLNEGIMRDSLQDQLRDAQIKHKASSKTGDEVSTDSPGDAKPRRHSSLFFPTAFPDEIVSLEKETDSHLVENLHLVGMTQA